MMKIVASPRYFDDIFPIDNIARRLFAPSFPHCRENRLRNSPEGVCGLLSCAFDGYRAACARVGGVRAFVVRVLRPTSSSPRAASYRLPVRSLACFVSPISEVLVLLRVVNGEVIILSLRRVY